MEQAQRRAAWAATLILVLLPVGPGRVPAAQASSDEALVVGTEIEPVEAPWGQTVRRVELAIDGAELADDLVPGVPLEGAGESFVGSPEKPVRLSLPGGREVVAKPTASQYMVVPVVTESGVHVMDLEGVIWMSTSGEATVALSMMRMPGDQWELTGGTIEVADGEFQVVRDPSATLMQDWLTDPELDQEPLQAIQRVVEWPEGRVASVRPGARTEGLPNTATDLRIMGVTTNGVSVANAMTFLLQGASDTKAALQNSSAAGNGTTPGGYSNIPTVTITSIVATTYQQSNPSVGGSLLADYIALVSGSGALSGVSGQRAAYAADLVSMIVPARYVADSSCGGGLNRGYATVITRETTTVCPGRKAVAHEVGHNLGGGHEDAGPYGSGCASTSPPTCSMEHTIGYPNARAYRYGTTSYCDVMHSDRTCRRLIYSTPHRQFPGSGVNAGTDTRNNAEAISDGLIAAACYGGAAPTGGTYTPMTPLRILDTRPAYGIGGYLTPAQPNVLRQVPVPSSVPADAAAVVVTVTAVSPSADGWITATECGEDPFPSRSAINYRAGRNRAQTVVVPLGDYRYITLTSSQHTHELVDLVGYFGGTGGQTDRLHVSPSNLPARVLDTRPANSGSPALYQGGAMTAGTSRTFNLALASPPAGTTVAVVNLTVTGATANGYMSIGAGPTTSTINYYTDGPESNLAFIPIDSAGEFDLFTSATVNVIADVTGWFSPAGTLSFVPCVPYRVTDTANLPASNAVDLWPSYSAVILSVVLATPTAGGGWLTVYPRPTPATPIGAPPGVSTVNGVLSESVNNHAIVSTTSGAIRVYYSNPASPTSTYRLVVDREGCFA